MIPTPEASLQVLERLCGKIDVYAATVVLPGVNDGDRLIETCEWLDEKGAKGLILMRFANTTGQGLILGNAPVIPGQHIQTPEEFSHIVTEMNDRCQHEGERYTTLGSLDRIPVRDPERARPSRTPPEARSGVRR